MKKIILAFMLLLPNYLSAQKTVLQNVYARDYQTLNGSWNYIIDPFDMGYYDYRLNENPNGFFNNQKAKQSVLSLLNENPNYFLFRGKPTVLITSGEHYGLLINSAFDYDTYLETLAKDSLNLTRVFSGVYLEHSGDAYFNITNNTLAPDAVSYLAPWARSEESGSAGGGNKFDLSLWDAKYFERLHRIIQKASEKGIVLEICLFGPMYNDTMWNISPMNAQNNIQKIGTVEKDDIYRLGKDTALLAVQEKLVGKLVRELNLYDNLYFEICNEPWVGVDMQWQRHITEVIVETEKELPNKHLISVNVADKTAKINNPHPSWSIFNFHYASPPVAIADNAEIQGVIGMNETGFHGVEDDYYRMEAWEFMMAGGGLYNNLDYSFVVGYENGSYPVEYPTPGGGSVTFRRQMGFLKQFMQTLNLREVKPIETISAWIVQGVPENIQPYGLAGAGKVYAFYLRKGSPRLTLMLPGATYRIRIADPAGSVWVSDRTVKHSGGALKLDLPENAGKEVAICVQEEYQYVDFNHGQNDNDNASWVKTIEVIEPACRAEVKGKVSVKFRAPGMNLAKAMCWSQPIQEHPNEQGHDVNLTPNDIQLAKTGEGKFVFNAADFPSGPMNIRIYAQNKDGQKDVFELQLYNKGGVKWNQGIPNDLPPAAKGMKLVFSDDFDTPLSISNDGRNARYNAHKPFFGDFSGWQFADADGPDNPFEQIDTYLKIKARKTPGTQGSSGLIASVDMDGKGFWAKPPCYLECRFTAQSAPGTWPAFWTITGLERGKPGDELDIIEGYGGDGKGNPNHPGYSIVSHFWGQKDATGNKKKEYDRVVPIMELGGKSYWSTTFHTYGVSIGLEETVYYFDNIEVLRHPTNDTSLNPHVFLINYAIGGLSGWGIDLERYGNGSDMYVDYVRVYAEETNPKVYLTQWNENPKMVESYPEFSDSKMVRDVAYIVVDPHHQYDEIIGFGGSVTDAAAETFAKLPQEKQKELLNAYYDKQEGLGYTAMRTNMNSCDFSSDSYDYVKVNDIELKSFDIEHDKKYKLPLIKQIQDKTGDDLLLYFSPWSPPAWMKTNNNMLQGGELKKEYYQTWADYFVKFIQSYEAEGVPVWGLTIQNEPQSVQPWESCIFDADVALDFIKNYLGPTLWKNNMKDKKLIAWDHNRDFSYHYVSAMLNDPETAKYIWGTGFHWYDWGKYENIDQVKKAFPDKQLAFTEGCIEGFDLNRIQEVRLGEYYATNLINDLNRGVVLWTDWNLVLDEKGGPNHVGNHCFAPVHAMTATGDLIYTSSYTYIGHFSKFIRPGAKRITASSNRFDLQTTSFINKDGTIVVVVLNSSDNTIPYSIFIEGKEAKWNSPAHSIATWVFLAIK